MLPGLWSVLFYMIYRNQITELLLISPRHSKIFVSRSGMVEYEDLVLSFFIRVSAMSLMLIRKRLEKVTPACYDENTNKWRCSINTFAKGV